MACRYGLDCAAWLPTQSEGEASFLTQGEVTPYARHASAGIGRAAYDGDVIQPCPVAFHACLGAVPPGPTWQLDETDRQPQRHTVTGEGEHFVSELGVGDVPRAPEPLRFVVELDGDADGQLGG